MKSQDLIIDDIRRALFDYGDAIDDELRVIDAHFGPVSRARVGIVFALVSPRCKFDRNARATPPLLDAIMTGASMPHLESILRDYGIGLAPTKARTLYDASSILAGMTYPPDRDIVLALRGAGLKVSAMAMALYSEWSPVFTLDTHMARGLDIPRRRLDIADRDYRDAERAILETIGEYFPSVSPFAVQWALWSVYSGHGFVSHLPIFGL